MNIATTRELLVAPDRADGAIGRQQGIDPLDHRGQRHAWHHAQRHLVEGALQIKRGGHALSVDPPDAKKLIVGRTALGSKHVFGRDRCAHDVHRLQPAVEDGAHRVARLERSGHGKSVAHQGFELAVALGPAPAFEREPVQALAPGMRPGQVQTDETTRHRRHHARQVDLRVHRVAQLHLAHAVDRRQPRAQMFGRALHTAKHVSQPVVLVERIARAQERGVHREHADKARHTDRHHHRDGGNLGAQPREVAPEFGVDGLHGKRSVCRITSSTQRQAACGC
jgi:hypothetical protein